MHKLSTSWLKRFWQENKGLILFIGLMLAFRSAIADWNDVPTGSMKPTILVGDRIIVDKLAYDISVPFTGVSLHKLDDPQRGDIIVFLSEVSDKRLVKRVVGVPGDSVALINNQLVVNGEVLQYSERERFDDFEEFTEDLLGIEHKVRLTDEGSPLSSFSSVIVPEGHYLAMGDNRNNSADSRVIGFVPRHEIVGRANYVMFSLDYDNYYLPRTERFFARL